MLGVGRYRAALKRQGIPPGKRGSREALDSFFNPIDGICQPPLGSACVERAKRNAAWNHSPLRAPTGYLHYLSDG